MSDSFDLTPYQTDLELIQKIQTGKGDKTFINYDTNNLYVELMFAGTTPRELEQDYINGNNNLYSAKAARWMYQFDNKPLSDGYTREWSVQWELFVQEEIIQWGKRS